MKHKGRIVKFERTGRFYCKLGIKLLNNKRFMESAKYFEKAISIEPDNCEYYFNLSGVLAEMGSVKESVNILENAIKKLNSVMPECYFAMGCNYFDLGNFKKSKYNFEKYCEVEPNGSFIIEAVEAIKFIDTNIFSDQSSRQLKIKNMANKGKKLLDKYEFSKAIKVLEKVIKLETESTVPRNNLSLAYYLSGDVGSAINAAREVLRIDESNSYANCNLALFYRTIDSSDLYKKQLRAVKNSRFDSVEEILNSVDILSKLSEDKVIRSLLEKLVKDHDEIILWHFLAISYHNTSRFSKAMEVWNIIKAKLPHMSIFTDCFVMESMKSIKNPLNSSNNNYDIKVFVDYITRIEELIEVLIDMDQGEFNKIWETNEHVRDIVNYFLYKFENKKKLKLIDKLANVEDDDAIHMLNTYVRNAEKRDEVSNKCEEIIMRKRVAGDAMVNIVEFSTDKRNTKKRQ